MLRATPSSIVVPTMMFNLPPPQSSAPTLDSSLGFCWELGNGFHERSHQ